MHQEYHVSAIQGCDSAPGTQAQPFRTISRAAQLAEAGDTVTVHEGTYREWVRPQHSGYSNQARIVYQAAPGESVVIKGSERVDTWEPYQGTVWKAVIPNALFGNFNPFGELLTGDWLLYPTDPPAHLGDVYLNGMSFYEAPSLAGVLNPEIHTKIVFPGIHWSEYLEDIPNPERMKYRWFAQVCDQFTTIYANFQGADPNRELTEINVRPCCFYPEKVGLNYITVRGFEMAQAACPWAPPTAHQMGLLGPHWSKGWIIEQNHLHDAKCSAISIGKEESTGQNLSARHHRKSGHQYQLEAVFRGLQIGWSKEHIGSHTIRNNVIHDCGQTGIVGHMGGAFSEICHNEIYNIATKREFFGHEIGGIKLHAAIDTQIHHNNIHHCTLGTWLDWQAQGARISKNIYHGNERDLMLEVTHGPCLVDNNIFAGSYNFDNIAQGTAFVNNLCCGIMHRSDDLGRATPYHFPHSTQVAGYAQTYSGDDRLYNNIFARGFPSRPYYWSDTVAYNETPATWEAFMEKAVQGIYREQASYFGGNCYLGGAEGCCHETERFVSPRSPEMKITTENGETFLEFTLEETLLDVSARIIDTEALGTPRIVEAPFEAPDGSPITLDTDLLDNPRANGLLVGPLASLGPGFNKIKIWG